jgi:hypothetical protein
VRLPAAAVVPLVVLLAAPALAQTYESYDTVVLGGMDKVTARFSSFEVEVGQPARFGTLEVTPRACQKTPPEETPESAAFLEIDDLKDESRVRVFTGWMFASSPGVSALEHAVYDIWVLDCVSPETQELEGESSDAEPGSDETVEPNE